ncbi:MAG: diguanylate cyclase/phosphodiesterase (GGDEF & EAL domains) with PAS/PAC sensor(s), partial [uncultured Solirubrobacterales bacterium]
GPTSGGAAQAHELAHAVHAALERPFDLDGTEVRRRGSGHKPLPARRRQHHRPAAPRRPGGRSGQASRRGTDPPVRRGDQRQVGTPVAGHAAAEGHRAGRTAPALPADREPRGGAVGRAGAADMARRVFAYEALVRRQDRDGLVPPAGFISLAEDLGL